MSEESAQKARSDIVLTLLARPLNGDAGNADIFPTVTKLLGIGVDLEARDEKGRTPLILATINFRPKLFAALIEAGADLSACDDEGLSCMDHHMLGKTNKLRSEALMAAYQENAAKTRQKNIEKASKAIALKEPIEAFTKPIQLLPKRPR